MTKIILHLCADTGSDTLPYTFDPYEYKVIKVGSDIGVENFRPPEGVWGIIANPPCLEFSTARVGGKARDTEEGMKLVKECIRIIQTVQQLQVSNDLQFWVIENPATGKLKDYLGKPTYVYQPWWFGSPWTKKTALWGEFNIPQRKYFKWEDVPNKISKLWVKKGRIIPSLAHQHKSAYDLIDEFKVLSRPESDMEFRSTCSQKFAQAFYEANR